MARCTGHCCRNFPLPLSLSDMKAKIDAGQHGANNRDGELLVVYGMVLPLSDQQNPSERYQDGRLMYRYTCKHLDADNNCGIYKTRPSMCSDYPYGNDCDHKDQGCTLTRNTGVTNVKPKKSKLLSVIDDQKKEVVNG